MYCCRLSQRLLSGVVKEESVESSSITLSDVSDNDRDQTPDHAFLHPLAINKSHVLSVSLHFTSEAQHSIPRLHASFVDRDAVRETEG